jgi:hypothetical protein
MQRPDLSRSQGPLEVGGFPSTAIASERKIMETDGNWGPVTICHPFIIKFDHEVYHMLS